MSRRCGGASSTTLLWLTAEIRGVAARMQLLDAVGVVAAAAAASSATNKAGGRCAAASAQLIDGLQAMLGPRLLQGGPQGDHSRRSRLSIMVGGDQALIYLVDQCLHEALNASHKTLGVLLAGPQETLAIQTRGIQSFLGCALLSRPAEVMAGSSADRWQHAPAAVQAAARPRCWWSC